MILFDDANIVIFISLPKKFEKYMQIFAKNVCGWRDNSYICRQFYELKTFLIMRKNIFITLLFSCVCLSSFADEPTTELVIWSIDGTQVAYALVDKPKITFNETDLVISVNDIDIRYNLYYLERITYNNSTGIEKIDLKTDEPLFKLDGESLLFPSLKANSTVSIFSLSGSLVLRKTISCNGEYIFPLSNLNTGVYMVNVNGLTYKITKR